METITDKNLKPCPFCNGKAHLVQGIGTKPYSIQCISCLVTTDESNSPSVLIQDWNHRVPTERPAPCQHYCEQQAFKIEIRTLRSLLHEANNYLSSDHFFITTSTEFQEVKRLTHKINNQLARRAL